MCYYYNEQYKNYKCSYYNFDNLFDFFIYLLYIKTNGKYI